MSAFVEVDHIDQVFRLPNGGSYVALRNIELKVRQESLSLSWVTLVVVNRPC